MNDMRWSALRDRFAGSLRHVLWLLAAVVAAGCRGETEDATAAGAELPIVQLIQPQVRTIVRVVGQPSFVESYERSSIFPKMTAYIEKWNVDIGDRVKKGDVLAKLFVPELVEEWGTKKATVKRDRRRVELAVEVVQVAEADVKAAEARLTEAKAILGKYQSEVDRWDSEVKRLAREVKGGVMDPQVLLESQNQLKSNTAARDAAKATIAKAAAELLSKKTTESQDRVAVDVARADLEVAESEAKRLKALVGYLVLPAPFDGVVTVRNVNTYDFVLPISGDPTAMRRSPHLSPGGMAAPLFVVDRTDIVRVFVDIPEHDANNVREGTKATVLIEAFSDEPIPAAVTRTSWALNVKSRTLRAEIDLHNTDNKILPGMYAYGKVMIERPDVWALPRAALDYEGDKTFYWTYRKGQAARMEVRTGVGDDRFMEVTNRRPLLSTGKNPWTPIDGSEQVIVGDLSALAEGEPVAVAGSDGTRKAQAIE